MTSVIKIAQIILNKAFAASVIITNKIASDDLGITTENEGRKAEVVVESAYFPGDTNTIPPPEVE